MKIIPVAYCTGAGCRGWTTGKWKHNGKLTTVSDKLSFSASQLLSLLLGCIDSDKRQQESEWQAIQSVVIIQKCIIVNCACCQLTCQHCRLLSHHAWLTSSKSKSCPLYSQDTVEINCTAATVIIHRFNQLYRSVRSPLTRPDQTRPDQTRIDQDLYSIYQARPDRTLYSPDKFILHLQSLRATYLRVSYS